MKAEVETVPAELRDCFGAWVDTNKRVRIQHANTSMWTKNEPEDAVVYPETTDEVSLMARRCHADGIPMIVRSRQFVRRTGECRKWRYWHRHTLRLMVEMKNAVKPTGVISPSKLVPDAFSEKHCD